eukprot:TRINITY_DN1260_c0_g1_i1.p1 TRINITY_DN1260_c0_g1~~TRINITY_DN1260_c0_g1_i1.p1  ORF type:complete len:1232 (+),score=482.44 TRINITY_DN1260_c0_g1_i1:394-4089(+)
MIFFLSSDDNTNREMCIKLMGCIVELRCEKNAVIEKKDVKEGKKYNFLEELLKQMCNLKKMDYFHGKDSTDFSFFVDSNKLEIMIGKLAQKEPKNLINITLEKLFQDIKKNQRPITASSSKLYEDRKIDMPLKKVFPICNIRIKKDQMKNLMCMEIEGDFSYIDKKQLDVIFMRDGLRITEISITNIKKQVNEILIPLHILEGSYYIHLENSDFYSNPIKYFHHLSSPFAQTSDIDDHYLSCCNPNLKIQLPPFNNFDKVDLRQRTHAMIASINGNFHFIKSLALYSSHHSFNNYINAIDEDGNTCLHFACLYGHFDIINCLIEFRADPNVMNIFGEVPLYYAQKFPNIFSYLIRLYPVQNILLPSNKFWKQRESKVYENWKYHFTNTSSDLQEMDSSPKGDMWKMPQQNNILGESQVKGSNIKRQVKVKKKGPKSISIYEKSISLPSSSTNSPSVSPMNSPRNSPISSYLSDNLNSMKISQKNTKNMNNVFSFSPSSNSSSSSPSSPSSPNSDPSDIFSMSTPNFSSFNLNNGQNINNTSLESFNPTKNFINHNSSSLISNNTFFRNSSPEFFESSLHENPSMDPLNHSSNGILFNINNNGNNLPTKPIKILPTKSKVTKNVAKKISQSPNNTPPNVDVFSNNNFLFSSDPSSFISSSRQPRSNSPPISRSPPRQTSPSRSVNSRDKFHPVNNSKKISPLTQPKQPKQQYPKSPIQIIEDNNLSNPNGNNIPNLNNKNKNNHNNNNNTNKNNHNNNNNTNKNNHNNNHSNSNNINNNIANSLDMINNSFDTLFDNTLFDNISPGTTLFQGNLFQSAHTNNLQGGHIKSEYNDSSRVELNSNRPINDDDMTDESLLAKNPSTISLSSYVNNENLTEPNFFDDYFFKGGDDVNTNFEEIIEEKFSPNTSNANSTNSSYEDNFDFDHIDSIFSSEESSSFEDFKNMKIKDSPNNSSEGSSKKRPFVKVDKSDPHFQVNWGLSSVIVYNRWLKPQPTINFSDLPKGCVVEVMLLNTFNEEINVTKRKNFFQDTKKNLKGRCLFELGATKGTISLKFGLNVTCNMNNYNSSVKMEDENGTNKEKLTQKPERHDQRFHLTFRLYDTKNNATDPKSWKEISHFISPNFTVVSHNDQILQNKKKSKYNIFPKQIPHNTNFPLCIVGDFTPMSEHGYEITFQQSNSKKFQIVMNHKIPILIHGLSPCLDIGLVEVFLGNSDILLIEVIDSKEWESNIRV